VARLLTKFGASNRAGLVRAAAAADTSDASGSDVLALLQSSLEEVLGTTASATLIARATKRAGLAKPDASTSADLSMDAASAIVGALWPLLIEMTGHALVRRLEARGFGEDGEITLEEVNKWMS